MDLFEFTEMLRRQQRILIAGAIIIIGLVAALGFEYDNGLKFRAGTRSESSIQMAVVPADFDSLASPLPNSSALVGTAGLYATMLATPETAEEISRESGVQLLDTLAVTTSGSDPFIGVKATAMDAEGSIQAALYSFHWLEQRLGAPLAIVRPDEPTEEQPTQSNLNADGELVSTIRVEASPAFTETATGLWVSLETGETDVTLSLADAGVETTEYPALLRPEADMVIALEDVFGAKLDEITVRIPPLPEPSTVSYSLTLRLDRGILNYPDSSVELGKGDPELLARHVSMSWQVTNPLGIEEVSSGTSDAVGLVLLTEDPVANVTGSRRGPVLILAALVAGFFGLLVLIVAIDTWSRAKIERRAEPVGRPQLAELGEAEPLWPDTEGRKWGARGGGPVDKVRERR